MLKLNLQYFGHLMWKANSLEKPLMLGKIEGGKRKGWQRIRWLDGITNSKDMSLSKFQEMKDRKSHCAAIHGVTKSRTWLSDWTELNHCNRMAYLAYVEWHLSDTWWLFGHAVLMTWVILSVFLKFGHKDSSLFICMILWSFLAQVNSEPFSEITFNWLKEEHEMILFKTPNFRQQWTMIPYRGKGPSTPSISTSLLPGESF